MYVLFEQTITLCIELIIRIIIQMSMNTYVILEITCGLSCLQILCICNIIGVVHVWFD